MKLACVVQRYGADIAGGSERHCRELAAAPGRAPRRHRAHHAAPPTTSPGTTSFPPASRWTARVRVRRFPVRRPRRLKRFADLSDEVFDGRAPPSAAGGMVPRERPRLPRPARPPARRGRRATTWCCSGPSATRRRSSACRSCATAPCWCPRPRRIAPWTSSVLEDFFQLPAGYLFLTPEEADAGVHARRPAAAAVGGHRHGSRSGAAASPRRRVRAGVASRTCCIWGASIATRAATRCSSTSPSYAGRRTTGCRWCWPVRPRCGFPRIRASARSAASATTSATRCCSRRWRWSCRRRSRA